MAKRFTAEELTVLGLTPEQVASIVAMQAAPVKDRLYVFTTKITQEAADAVNLAFPELKLTRKQWRTEEYLAKHAADPKRARKSAKK